MKFDSERLRKDLLKIYTQYLEDPNNPDMIKVAEEIYFRFMNAMPLLSPKLQEAVNLLVNLFAESGLTPSKTRIKKLLNELNR